MEEQFVDEEQEWNCPLGNQHEDMVEVEVVLVEDDREAEKIVAMNVETEVTSLETVVAVDAAGNFHDFVSFPGHKEVTS